MHQNAFGGELRQNVGKPIALPRSPKLINGLRRGTQSREWEGSRRKERVKKERKGEGRERERGC